MNLILPFLTIFVYFGRISSYLTIKLTPTDFISKTNQSNNPLDDLPSTYDRFILNVTTEKINQTLSKNILFSAYSITLNMSYSQLFLRLSFDFSLIYIQTLKSSFNATEIKNNLYSSSDENCWTKSAKQDFCYSESYFNLYDEKYSGNALEINSNPVE